ncbi:AraC family transcriptional regulator [Opitutaceae bacterium TAV4]|nr:AraC family transcriptional regulator [Opitutaceae bacterium TAV4]RRK00993.1 AraC family transcriptional regulator [Opitutaceae bacterium TAV3]RRK02157.1 AraC family transcriptional regulator [Opitutaceae bacterium TAV3]
MLKFLLHAYGEFTRSHGIRNVSWPHFDLLFVHAGCLELRVMEEEPFRLKSGEGVLLYPHTRFSGDVLSGRSGAGLARASVQHFVLTEPGDNAVLRFWAGKQRGFALLKGETAKGAARDVERAIELSAFSSDEVNRALRVAQLTLLLGLVRRCAQAQLAAGRLTQGGGTLQQVISWAREQHGIVTVDELARRAGYSPGHFRLLFEQAFRERPAAFLLRLRINEAKRLLGESRQAIKEIAGKVGYSDAVAFHRAFTRMSGCPPGKFRKRSALTG